MILRCRFLCSGRDDYRGLELDGHAGEHPRGENLLCAAATTLVQTLILGLKDELGLELAVSSDRSGYLSLELESNPDRAQQEKVNLLFRCTEKGLQYLQGTVPDTEVIRIEHSYLEQGVNHGT